MAPPSKADSRKIPITATTRTNKAKGINAHSPANSNTAVLNGISNTSAVKSTSPTTFTKAQPVPQHNPHPSQQGPTPSHIQHLSRPASIVQQQQQQQQQQQTNPGSPHQPSSGQHPGQYGSTQALPLQQHQSPYSPPGGPGAQYNQVPQYGTYPSPYGASQQGQYSSAENPESMAAAQMHRPFQPMYGYSPQNNSPASVQSPQSHDAHGRPLYQPQQPMPMYPNSYQPLGPSVNQVHQSQGQHQPQQHHQNLPSQSLLMSYQQSLQSHQQQPPSSHPGMTNSPRTKMEPINLHRPMDQPNIQRPPSTSINTNLPAPAPPSSANSLQQNSPGSAGGANSNAAPGPIPATTPLVVRQDNNGVQWIAFEYSRDRVKMEYTIRCDVESVNTDNLTSDFKTENCVYPRACCSKEQYRGNRLQYESECNTVGWALADLNPCLRGKRGLIQRAVDSWRNSNSDPKLRSRRVRRQAKMQSRSKHQLPNHLPATGIPSSGSAMPSSSPAMVAPLQRQPQQPMGMGAAGLQHHHHQTDGPQGNEDVGAGSSTGMRPIHVFQGAGYSTYPPQSLPSSSSTYPTSMPPPLHDPHTVGYNLPQPSGGGPIATSVLGKRSYSEAVEAQEVVAGDAARKAADLFGSVPPEKRRKFIIVEDGQKGGRVRVRVEMDRVRMSEVPDSYMRNNSVFPRAWKPVVAPDVEWDEVEDNEQTTAGGAGGSGSGTGRRRYRGRNERFSAKRTAGSVAHQAAEETAEADETCPTVGCTTVRAPLLEEDRPASADGRHNEVRLDVPRLTESKKYKEGLLNEMGYRLSWAQSRVFAGRVQFLQKSLDAYRNKVRSTIIQTSSENVSGEETEPPYIAPQFHTRRGKGKYLERKKKMSSKARDD